MPVADMPDTELMTLVTHGRKEAFVEIVRRHQKSLLNFFRSLGVHTDAEDLAQETFVRLFKYRDRYRPSAKFTTFLYLLARQVRIDMLRRQKRREDLEDRLVKEHLAEESGLPSGGRAAMDVEAALDVLPEAMRSIVVLNIYQGLKYREIAEVLDIPVGTVKSRMFEALKRLREVFHVGG